MEETTKNAMEMAEKKNAKRKKDEKEVITLGAWCNPASLRAPVMGMIRRGSSDW